VRINNEAGLPGSHQPRQREGKPGTREIHRGIGFVDINVALVITIRKNQQSIEYGSQVLLCSHAEYYTYTHISKFSAWVQVQYIRYLQWALSAVFCQDFSSAVHKKFCQDMVVTWDTKFLQATTIASTSPRRKLSAQALRHRLPPRRPWLAPTRVSTVHLYGDANVLIVIHELLK